LKIRRRKRTCGKDHSKDQRIKRIKKKSKIKDQKAKIKGSKDLERSKDFEMDRDAPGKDQPILNSS